MIVTLELSDGVLEEALTAAYRTGLDWADRVRSFEGRTGRLEMELTRRTCTAPLADGKWVIRERATSMSHALTTGRLMNGLALIAASEPTLFAVLSGHHRWPSAEDGDRLVQYALFGRVKYERPRDNAGLAP